MEDVSKCDRLAYLGYGTILQTGTISEIIEHSGICTFAVSGSDLTSLALQLRNNPDIKQITTFYKSIHVSSSNKEELEQSIMSYKSNSQYTWQIIEPSLEDALVWLIRNTHDKRFQKEI